MVQPHFNVRFSQTGTSNIDQEASVAVSLFHSGDKACSAINTSTTASQPDFSADMRSSHATWEGALAGVESVYITYAPDLAIPGATDAIRDFVACVVQANVKRLVLLSGRGEEAQRCEQIVQDSGLQWTVVRANWFSQNFSEGEFLEMVLGGAITLPAPDVLEPFVDVDDIADVAVAALTEDTHNGQTYEVTGPRMLTFREAAEEISRAAGREVVFVPLSRKEFAAGVSKSGVSTDNAWLLNYLFETVLDDRNAFLCDGIQQALGRQPKDFAVFAKEIAGSGLWDVSQDVCA